MSGRARFSGPSVGSFFCLGLVLIAAGTSAKEYSFDYSVEAGGEVNDNVRLTTEDELEVSGGVVVLPAALTARSERLKTSLEAELTFSRYDEESYDSDDQDVKLGSTYQLERGQLEGVARYLRDTTRTGEFLDTGEVGLTAVRRETGSFQGSGSYLFTERNGISGGVLYRNVDYDSPRFQDYEFSNAYGGWLHQWTERTELTAQLYYSYYENDAPIQVESDSLGARFGFTSKLSEQWETSLTAGWVKVSTDYAQQTLNGPSDNEADDLLLKGSVKYSAERHQFTARLQSEPSPSGNGTMYSDYTAALEYRYLVSERSRFDLNLIGGAREAVDDRITNDRDFARLRMRIDYRMSQSWYIAAAYQHSYQDRERALDDASSNEFRISVIYQPERMIWSR